MTEAMADKNRTPEQKARDTIDQLLDEAGWKVQSKNEIDFSAGFGIAIREYQTDVGPADYVLFIDKNPVGVIEAKPEDWGQKITTVEDQSAGLRGRKAEMAQQQGACAPQKVDPALIARFVRPAGSLWGDVGVPPEPGASAIKCW